MGYDNDEDVIQNEDIDERLITLQEANNNVTDDVLYLYISQVGGQTILEQLQLHEHWTGEHNTIRHNQSQYDLLRRKYHEEMKEFMTRIREHPAMVPEGDLGIQIANVDLSSGVPVIQQDFDDTGPRRNQLMTFVRDIEG